MSFAQIYHISINSKHTVHRRNELNLLKTFMKQTKENTNNVHSSHSNVSLPPKTMQLLLVANIVIFDDKSLSCSGMPQTWQF